MEKNGEIKVTPIAPPKAPATRPAPAPAVKAAAIVPPEAPAAPKAGSGTVGGKVMLSGPAPKNDDIAVDADAACAAQHPNGMQTETVVVSAKGELKNVIVSVSSGLNGPFEVPATPAVITQKGCQYLPHVLAMMTGQKLLIRNDDPFLHNVHTLSSDNPPFNFGQPNKDPGKDAGSFKSAETFRVKCDVHPWMSMSVAVFDHPFFAVTGDDGSFTLPPLPAGTYTITFWHEKYGTQDKEVVVEPGKKVDLNITFGP
jgi:plastocyanin